MRGPFGIIPRDLGVLGGVCESLAFPSGWCLAYYIVGLQHSVWHELELPDRALRFTCVMRNRVDKNDLKSTMFKSGFRVIHDQSE